MGMSIPGVQELGAYNPNRPNDVEGLAWDMYDRLNYPAAGTTQMMFFQTPQGQNGKTLADTNMTFAGAMPSPQAFLVTGINLIFFPGEEPSSHGVGAASAFVNDTYTWWSSLAWLTLHIGSKDYLQEAPLLKFPPKNGLSGFAASSDATTPAAGLQTLTAYASGGGMPFEVNPPVLLPTTQNFNVTIAWPALVPISAQASVFCNLEGFLYRNSQ